VPRRRHSTSMMLFMSCSMAAVAVGGGKWRGALGAAFQHGGGAPLRAFAGAAAVRAPPPPRSSASSSSSEDAFCEATRLWVQRAVVDLKLCPWAASSKAKIISCPPERSAVAKLVAKEMQLLADTTKSDGMTSTTLIVVKPPLLDTFDPDFLQAAEDADRIIDELGLRGRIQLATFHPQYHFAGTNEQDASNWTNRSPFPVLHLLREDDVTEAARSYEALGGTDRIWERNVRTMEEIGRQSAAAVVDSCRQDGLVQEYDASYSLARERERAILVTSFRRK
jgi:hypothetical protein